jgi:hypothetical protein
MKEICRLEGLRETTNHFSPSIRCPSRYSNRYHPEYKPQALPLWQVALSEELIDFREIGR